MYPGANLIIRAPGPTPIQGPWRVGKMRLQSMSGGEDARCARKWIIVPSSATRLAQAEHISFVLSSPTPAVARRQIAAVQFQITSHHCVRNSQEIRENLLFTGKRSRRKKNMHYIMLGSGMKSRRRKNNSKHFFRWTQYQILVTVFLFYLVGKSVYFC